MVSRLVFSVRTPPSNMLEPWSWNSSAGLWNSSGGEVLVHLCEC